MRLIQLFSFAVITGILVLVSGVHFSYQSAQAQPNSQSNPNSAIPVWLTSQYPSTASMIQYTGTLATSAVVQVAASAVGLTNRIASIQITNASGPAQTVYVMDGSRILWQVYPASGTTITSNMSLVGSASSVLNVQNATGTGAVIVNIQGAQY